MKLIDKNVLLFDLDGTLVDSVPDLALAINQMLNDLDITKHDEDTIRHWVGNGAKTLVERALTGSLKSNEQLTVGQIDEALTIFLRHYQQCLCSKSALYKDVKTGLLTLKNAGFRLAIITNKPEKFIQPLLNGLGLHDIFELLIGGDTLTERKPHPAPLNYAVEQLNVTATQCLSKSDILAAKAANIASIGLTYGYNHGEDLNNYQPQWCFDSFGELLVALQR